MSLSTTSVFAKTITGSQCRKLLSPIIEQVDNPIYRQAYITINNEIPAVRNTSLADIAKVNSKTSVVQNYVNAVNKAISQCSQNCQGLPLKHGRKFSCERLSADNMNPLLIKHGLGNELDDNATAEVEDIAPAKNIVATPAPKKQIDPACAFDSQSEGCQVSEPTIVAPVENNNFCTTYPQSEGCQMTNTQESSASYKTKIKSDNKANRSKTGRVSNGFSYERTYSPPQQVEVGI